MKKIALFTLISMLLFTGSISAQDTLFAEKKDDMKTVFGSPGKIEHGGYGAFTMGYTTVDDQGALLMGGRAGWLINHRFTLGLAGYGFFNNLEKRENLAAWENYTIAGGYGGLFMEAIIAPNYPVHVTIPLMIGAGGVSVNEGTWWDEQYWDYYNYDASAFFVIEPGIEVELNIVKFFRLAVGANYRWTNGIDLTYSWYEDGKYQNYEIPADILDGFSYHMTLKFGWF